MTALTLPADAVIRMFGAVMPHLPKKGGTVPVLEYVRVTVRDNLAFATATDRYTLAMHAESTECENLEVLVSLDEAKAAVAAAKAVAAPTAPVVVPGSSRDGLDYPNLTPVVSNENYEPGMGAPAGKVMYAAPDQVVKVDKTVRALKLKGSDLWVAHNPTSGIVRYDIGERTSVWLMPVRQAAPSSPTTVDWGRVRDV